MEISKIDRTSESIILDAVRMGKGNFVELYHAMGYDAGDVGLAWHQIRVSSRGRAVMEAEYAKAYPKGIPHVRQPLTFVNVEEELKSRNIELKQKPIQTMSDSKEVATPSKKKEVAKEKVAKPKEVDGDRGKKTAVAKQLIEGGETNAATIAEKSGAAVAYVRTLLYNYRKANKK